MVIARSGYLQKLIDRKHNGLVKIVTGIRRCGKSYLLFTLFKQHLLSSGVPEDRIIQIQLDDRQNKALRNPDACDEFVRSRIGEGQHYVLLDEVQMMPEFEDVLNGFLHIENLDTYVTGSNSKFLSTDIITEFRGRGDEVRVHPLSFAEYHAAINENWDDDWNNYATYGGLPYVALLKADNDKAAYLQRLFTETYLRDIIERNKVKNDGELSDLVDIVASAIGSLTNPQKLENTSKTVKRVAISAPTIKKYLGYLEGAFIITPSKRYDVKGRKHISTPLKYYFEDIGLRNARLNFRQQEETHILENILFNELIVRGFQVDVGIVDITKGGQRKRVEIDFVANQGSRRYYLQSAFALPDAEKRAQEERPLLAVGDSFKKIIVVGSNVKLSRDENGVVTIGLKEFLLNPDSLDL
ncbi:MAG: ATP-binding protein [Gordonibacter sp.]|uniref:ATP-binding protein n=1 Tax=Gordonibacter sp. TaxID=1968902 RepID=UPI002FCB6597